MFFLLAFNDLQADFALSEYSIFRFPFRFQLLPAAKNVIIQNTKINRNTNKCLYIVDTDLDNLYNNNACVNEFNFDL